MTANAPGDGWQARLIKPRLGLAAQANRPAEVSDLLSSIKALVVESASGGSSASGKSPSAAVG